MALTISERRYQEIRTGVLQRPAAEKELRELVAEIVSEPGAMTFATVDEFFRAPRHLGTV